MKDQIAVQCIFQHCSRGTGWIWKLTSICKSDMMLGIVLPIGHFDSWSTSSKARNPECTSRSYKARYCKQRTRSEEASGIMGEWNPNGKWDKFHSAVCLIAASLNIKTVPRKHNSGQTPPFSALSSSRNCRIVHNGFCIWRGKVEHIKKTTKTEQET